MHALIFDVDGTLIDSVYTHVVSWQKSFAAEGTQVPAWCIHTKIGLSGKELALAIGRELGKPVSEEGADGLDKRHDAIMKKLLPRAEPLPGAVALLRL
jgi:beta-phosphoglucomutase-like phosphatase (HAD superfamily)